MASERREFYEHLLATVDFDALRADAVRRLRVARLNRTNISDIRRRLKDRRHLKGDEATFAAAIRPLSVGPTTVEQGVEWLKGCRTPREASFIFEVLERAHAFADGSGGREPLVGAVAEMLLEAMTGYPVEYAAELLGQDRAADLLARVLPVDVDACRQIVRRARRDH